MSELTREELLVLLVEECGEVIQAATKCLRFGFTRQHEGYGQNDHVLAREMGELIAVMDSVPLTPGARISMTNGRQGKMRKAMAAKDQYGAGALSE